MPDAIVIGPGAIGNEVAHTAPVGFVRSHILGTIIEQFNEAAEQIVNFQERRNQAIVEENARSPEASRRLAEINAEYVRSLGLEPAGDGIHLRPVTGGRTQGVQGIVPPLWNKDP